MKPIPLRPALSSARRAVFFLLALAVFAVAAALTEWIMPSTPDPAGRLSWLIAAVHSIAGTHGLVALWLLFALMLLTAARFVWRHTARRPTDRLFG